jgi:hypothetical protein
LAVGVEKRKLFCGFEERKRDSFKVSAKTGLANVN